MSKLWAGHKQVSLKPMLKVLNVTLIFDLATELTVTVTFDLVTRFLFATLCLVMIIICIKLFSNPIMHDEVMNRTQTGFTEAYAQSISANCDLDL